MLARWFGPLLSLALAAWALPARTQETTMGDGRWSIAIHGGAGTMDRVTMSEAQRRGYTWLGLETGVPEPFIPARTLYASYGFSNCEAFSDYVLDDWSVCMSRAL